MPISALPSLTEKRGIDPALVNGVAAADLTTDGDQKVSVTFVDENAGFLSTLVAYTIAADGTFGPATLVFENVDGPDRGGGPLSSGETVEVGSYSDGTQLGLALLQDAASKSYDLSGGTLEFRAADGSPANISDAAPPELYLVAADGSETRIDVPIFHTADGSPSDAATNALNPGGAEHSISAVDADGNVTIAFEDVVSTAKNFDGDYNDAIIQVSFADDDGVPPVTEPEPPVTDPGQTVDSSPVTLPDGQTVALSVRTEATTDDDTAELSGILTLTGFLASNFNIAFVNDASGSTGSRARDAAGNSIDLDGDGRPDTVFDAQVAAFLELARQITAAGLGDADLGIVSFGSRGALDGVTNVGEAGIIESVLANPTTGGSTNYADALRKTIDFFEAQDDVDSASNIVYFLSDGRPNIGGDFAPNFGILTDPSGTNALSNAFGAGTGAIESVLDQVDNTGGAEVFTDLSQLVAGLSGSSLSIDDILSVDIVVNGVTQATLDNTAFSNTATGLQFGPVQLTGLDPTAVNTVDIEAVLETDDGQLFDLVVQTEIVGTAQPTDATASTVDLSSLVAEPEAMAI